MANGNGSNTAIMQHFAENTGLMRYFRLVLMLFMVSVPGAALANFNPANVVPTYHCLGILCPRQILPADAPTTAAVRYQAVGEAGPWRNAQPLIFNRQENRFVGSIVNLDPGKQYAIQVDLPAGPPAISSAKPITLYKAALAPPPPMSGVLDKASRQLHVSPKGSDDGPGTADKPLRTIQRAVDLVKSGTIVVVHDGVYREQVSVRDAKKANPPIMITAADGETPIIDGEGVRDHAIDLDAVYDFQVHGFKMRNTRRSIIRANNSMHITITSNTLADPGDHYYDSAIEIGRGCSDTLIQGNLMTFPHRDYTGGGMGITLRNTDGRHIIFDNHIIGDGRIKDGIGGEDNFGIKGGPYRDSDIYNNTISGCRDDAIESEGGGLNVRIWGNRLSDSLVGIALAPVIMGPTYVWRNTVVNCGPAFKLGEGHHMGHGPLFLYHNTSWSTSTENGGYAGSGGKGLFEHVTGRNNLISINGLIFFDRCKSPNNSFDYDLLNPGNPARFLEWGAKGNKLSLKDARAMGFWTHAVVADPRLSPSSDLSLLPESPAIDAGTLLPNFNDDYSGRAPDIGAIEY